MNETASTTHGRLLEALHIASYTVERATRELKWLLEDDRWKKCGDGFDDIDDFVATLQMQHLKKTIEERKEIVQLLSEKRATQRAIAEAMGVGTMTVNRDLKPDVPNDTKQPQKQPIKSDFVPSGTPENSDIKQPQPSPVESKPAFQAPAEEVAKALEEKQEKEWKHIERIEKNKQKILTDSEEKASETVEIGVINSFVVRDENMLKVSSEPSPSRLGIGDWVVSFNEETINTVTRLSRFFHKETMVEFSLREYADVQTFPKDYKFIGLDSEIKSQIGNAVAPKMGEYISRNLKGKTAGDLFAGAGGFSCGLHAHGIKSLWAVEWETHAAQAYKLNNPEARVFNTNIAKLDPADFEPVDIIIGGPPCQGFSTANSNNSGKRSFKSDPRNELYKEFLRFVEHLKPAEFIMENVAQIMDVKDEIVEDFEQAGYSVSVEIVYGPDIGMKQTRKRCFFIGERK